MFEPDVADTRTTVCDRRTGRQASGPLSEELVRLTIDDLGDRIEASISRALWGEFLPTLLLVIGSWWICSSLLFPRARDQAGAWVLVYACACATLALAIFRLFVVQHDAGHNALSPSITLNQLIGRICSVFELTPFTHWHRHHWRHHCTSGNLEKQDGLGEIYTLTVNQFMALPRWKQRAYQLYRSPWHLFLILPTSVFVLLHRVPLVCSPFSPTVQRLSWAEWIDIVALDGIYLGLGWLAYSNWTVAQPWIVSYAIAFVTAASVGMVLIYSQHQWEGAYYTHGDNWSFYESAMNGSMTLRLPFAWLEWGIGYINYHSVHHLKPNIPMYHLQKCYQRLKRLQVPVAECHLRDIWITLDRALWDERQQRMISFAELGRHRQGLEP